MDGTVHLERGGSLKNILNEHKFLDGSAVFVVDQSGKIFYHSDSNQINDSPKDHPLVKSITKGKSGYGHLVGDDVLRHLSSMMQEISREDDLCFRYGGEEFAILTTVQSDHDAFKIAERLRTKFSLEPNPTGHPITISSGISSNQSEEQNYNEMVKRADSALYQSKMNGRNRTIIYGG